MFLGDKDDNNAAPSTFLIVSMLCKLLDFQRSQIPVRATEGL